MAEKEQFLGFKMEQTDDSPILGDFPGGDVPGILKRWRQWLLKLIMVIILPQKEKE